MLAYAILKTIHVLAVIMFLGNIAVGGFWKAFADRTNDPRVMAYTIRGIIQADRIFTIPGVILILLAGFATAGIGGVPILSTGWVLWALILFIIAGIAFGPIARAQRQLEAIARTAADGGTFDAARYASVSNTWNVAGTIGLVLPIVAVILMVMKPALPAF
jgi:uncharacterized membrane protein